MEILVIVVSVAIAAFVAYHLYRWMFEDSAEFWDCFRFSITPDIFSMFRGEYFEDLCKSAKLSFFLMAIGLSGFMAYLALSEILGMR